MFLTLRVPNLNSDLTYQIAWCGLDSLTEITFNGQLCLAQCTFGVENMAGCSGTFSV